MSNHSENSNSCKSNLVLSGIEPINKLKTGDIVYITRDIDLFLLKKSKNKGHLHVNKGSSIEIIDIKDPNNHEKHTKSIFFIVCGDDEIFKMSNGIFIDNFCENIKTEQKEYSRIKKEKEIKEGKGKKINTVINNTKEKSNFFIRLKKKLINKD